MNYTNTIWAATLYIEGRLEGRFDYEALAKESGFSLQHLREVFVRHTGKTLHRYVTERKVANAAFALTHGDESVLSLALRYGFSGSETFARAFHRVTGTTPQAFRRARTPVGRKKLCDGAYAVALDVVEKEERNMEKQRIAQEGSVILYGVPKVYYGAYGGVTPYPICVKACANYLGREVSYARVLTECGGAFRLTWNTRQWDGGNVAIVHAFEDPWQVYRLGMASAGYGCEVLERAAGDMSAEGKQAFLDFLKPRLEAGMPVIALGVVGPPEASIIAGYRRAGAELLGWSFFQEGPEQGGSVSLEENGYFATDAWWENPMTLALLGMEEIQGEGMPLSEVLRTGAEVLRGRQAGDYAKGLAAYPAWKSMLLDDAQFPAGGILPVLMERLYCHGDAMDSLADGRHHAAEYLHGAAEGHPERRDMLQQAAGHFAEVPKRIEEMARILGGWERGEAQLERMMRTETRQALARQIEAAEQADTMALACLEACIEI